MKWVFQYNHEVPQEAFYSLQNLRIKKSNLKTYQDFFLLDVRPNSDYFPSDGVSFPHCDLRLDISLIKQQPSDCFYQILKAMSSSIRKTKKILCVCLRGNSSLTAATILNQEEENLKGESFTFFSLLLE